jgi:hypothetical protein
MHVHLHFKTSFHRLQHHSQHSLFFIDSNNFKVSIWWTLYPQIDFYQLRCSSLDEKIGAQGKKIVMLRHLSATQTLLYARRINLIALKLLSGNNLQAVKCHSIITQQKLNFNFLRKKRWEKTGNNLLPPIDRTKECMLQGTKIIVGVFDKYFLIKCTEKKFKQQL